MELKPETAADYPAQLEPNSINHTFMTVMDILPTFLELAGTRHPGAVEYNGRNIQSIVGRSFWSNITGDAPTVHGDENSAGWSFRGRGAIIKGRFKLTNQPQPGLADAPLVWKLYDIEADPGEIDDIADANPELVEALLSEWRRDWQ